MPNTGAESPVVLDSGHLHIAVAVIRDSHGRILISERKTDCAYAGQWEFPGGKVEQGETVQQALVRELQEELGLDIHSSRKLITIQHAYPDRRVHLDTWEVTSWSGQPESREGQRFEWVVAADLLSYPMLEANRPIVAAALLPDRYMITPQLGDDAELLRGIDQALASGISLFRLRQPDLDDGRYLLLAEKARVLAERHAATLLVDRKAVSQELGLGLHLSSRELMSASGRPVPDDLPCAASCHDPEELKQACKLGVDFAVIGPIGLTQSHPGQRPLGLERASDWVGGAGLPVYGIGGMREADIPRVRACGMQGIAAIRGLWPHTPG